MKYFYSIFLTILTLLLFSCAGKPDSQTDEIFPKPPESVEPLDEFEHMEDEIIGEDTQDSFEIAEIESEDGQVIDYIDEQIDDTEELAEVISDSFETAGIDEQIVDEPAPVEETPPVVTAPQVTQAPAQTLPPVSLQPQTPPPAPPQTPPPEPVQPQSQTPAPQPRQPPVPPPALIGPAEERPPSQRETVPPRIEPRIEPRVEPPAPVTGSEPPIRPIVTPQNDGVVFSRTVRATVGQIIEIPFVGTGWIYMGELASRRGIVYNSTRRDAEGQSIIFGAEEAGTYVLRFYKENFLVGYIINDYVQVIVGEAQATGGTGWFAPPYDRGRVVALPRWPSALDAQLRDNEQSGSFSADDFRPSQTQAEIGGSGTVANTPPAGTLVREPSSSQGTAPSQGTTAMQGAAPSEGTRPSQGTQVISEPVSGGQERLTPDVILQRAEETFTGGNVAAAIALLDQFREYYPSGSDELYWLYGQFYEANSPSRNILLSLDFYRRLVNEYPQSSRVNDARRRIAYLERFYINIQ